MCFFSSFVKKQGVVINQDIVYLLQVMAVQLMNQGMVMTLQFFSFLGTKMVFQIKEHYFVISFIFTLQFGMKNYLTIARKHKRNRCFILIPLIETKVRCA